ncbi:hypothetical protein CTheo_8398 [Ceratobasidium theobromae]|uniref:Uncharacterized protein n=1 Tax=Ceratobasidium theobromae TaxID=1582974 RepID=A0A5N5Q964_9AGAM|nr:hypothetical protein CTheo_8398 [Ceratobasidium theobromae]
MLFGLSDNVAHGLTVQKILDSLPNPPPRPEEPGNWFLLRGSHWLSCAHDNSYWMTMTDDNIRAIMSADKLHEIGPINEQQLGLAEAVQPCPLESRSLLQRQVAEFVDGFLSTTNHPLAHWECVTHGIRKGSNGVWSPYDLTGYRFIHKLRKLHSSSPRDHGNEYMFRLMGAILRSPGRYSRLISEYYPDVTTLPSADPIDRTFLDSNHLFNSDLYAEVNVKAVLHYMWEILKIPRHAARFNLEPYMQLSSSIESAVGVWIDLMDLLAKAASAISYRGSMTMPQAEASLHFLGQESIPFECSLVPFKNEDTGAVLWRMPPPDAESLITSVKIHKDWIPQESRAIFEGRLYVHQWALGDLEFM